MINFRSAKVVSELFFLFSISISSGAQTACGTDAYHQFQRQSPQFLQLEKQITSQWKNFKHSATRQTSEDLYTLPVVFHIIHKNGAENISDAAVIDAFQRLNDAFANRGIYDQGSGADTKIQFCLAKKDPDGNSTTGITRTYADLLKVVPIVHDSFLKSLINWDPTRYVNIWVVSEIDMIIEFNRCGYSDLEDAGYATFPPGHGSSSDGIVAEAGALSAVITHEMGHYLGLYHTFQDWCVNNDCTTDGDQVCDTPPEETIAGACGKQENSCHTDVLSGFTTDQPDLTTNHMDYGNYGCQHDFTQGQKERMRFMIETIRTSLLTSDVCTNECAQPAEAEFTFNTNEYSIGNTVDFTNTSAQAQSYEWSVNNAFVSNNVSFSYTFPGQGWYKIELLAKPSPDEVKCRNNQINWIRVYCSIKSIVKADKKKAIVGETVHFSSTVQQVVNMPDPIVYEWYYNNTLFGNSPSFDYTFNTPGIKIFYLVTIQGGCRDTSMADMVDIKRLPDYTLKINHRVCTGVKDNKISFSVCNDGFADMPAGVPITFYSSNPTIGPASVAGSVFYTNEVITKFCCKDFEFELPAGYNGSFLYGVVNDDHTIATPYDLATDFPVTNFPESNYTNNLDSLSLEKFSVTISPAEAVAVIGSSVSLTGTANQPASFQWIADDGSFSCDTCATTSFVPRRYTRVILKGITPGNCVATDTIFVKVLANGEVFIPSAFTPNSDNLNDYFFVIGGESVSNISSFMVFNRWGQMVFLRQNTLPNIPYLGWNGKLKGHLASVGVYVYLITVDFIDGVQKKYKGFITLIR